MLFCEKQYREPIQRKTDAITSLVFFMPRPQPQANVKIMLRMIPEGNPIQRKTSTTTVVDFFYAQNLNSSELGFSFAHKKTET